MVKFRVTDRCRELPSSRFICTTLNQRISHLRFSTSRQGQQVSSAISMKTVTDDIANLLSPNLVKETFGGCARSSTCAAPHRPAKRMCPGLLEYIFLWPDHYLLGRRAGDMSTSRVSASSRYALPVHIPVCPSFGASGMAALMILQPVPHTPEHFAKTSRPSLVVSPPFVCSLRSTWSLI